MDFFTVTCLKCGHSFGLSDKELFEMRSCSCPNCGQRMSNWTFYETKRKYFESISMIGRVLSLGPFAPEKPNFAIELAGNSEDSEDVRLLKFLIAVFDELTAAVQDKINKIIKEEGDNT